MMPFRHHNGRKTAIVDVEIRPGQSKYMEKTDAVDNKSSKWLIAMAFISLFSRFNLASWHVFVTYCGSYVLKSMVQVPKYET